MAASGRVRIVDVLRRLVQLFWWRRGIHFRTRLICTLNFIGRPHSSETTIRRGIHPSEEKYVTGRNISKNLKRAIVENKVAVSDTVLFVFHDTKKLHLYDRRATLTKRSLSNSDMLTSTVFHRNYKAAQKMTEVILRFICNRTHDPPLSVTLRY